MTHTGPMTRITTGAVAPRAERRASLGLPDVLTTLVVVTLGGGLGAVGGWLWWTWWAPAKEGEIYRTSAGPTWYPDPLGPGIAQVFDATAQYVVVGTGLGLLLGAAVGWAARNRALAGLVGVLVGSGLAAYVASRVGLSFSPPDPQALVAQHQVGDRLPAQMTMDGWTPYLAWPVGALLGFVAALLSVSSVREVRRRETDTSAWLEARPRS